MSSVRGDSKSARNRGGRPGPGFVGWSSVRADCDGPRELRWRAARPVPECRGCRSPARSRSGPRRLTDVLLETAQHQRTGDIAHTRATCAVGHGIEAQIFTHQGRVLVDRSGGARASITVLQEFRTGTHRNEMINALCKSPNVEILNDWLFNPEEFSGRRKRSRLPIHGSRICRASHESSDPQCLYAVLFNASLDSPADKFSKLHLISM